MSRRRVFILSALVIILVAAGGTILLGHELREPPLEMLRQAMDAVETARSLQADKQAPRVFGSAKESLEAARRALDDINKSWWPFETYHAAESLLAESIQLSDLAVSQTRNRRASQDSNTRREIAALRDSVDHWQNRLESSLPRTEDNLLHRSAVFHQQMAERMLQNKRPDAARKYADTVRTLLAKLGKRDDLHQASDQTLLKRSKDWIGSTLALSRESNDPVIIVDKGRHQLYVLRSGRVTDSIPCDLGYNSGYQKRFSGDGATPEGTYIVTRVNRASKYYLALLLNYPNDSDRQRFAANIKAGNIPKNSKIGGLIEIHGHGGTGKDWTDGCVAIDDREMEGLLKICKVGTPVTIVRAWEHR